MRPWPWRGFARPEEFPEDAIPFDALGAEFAHQGEDCTFETLLKRTGLRDRRLAQLAQIVPEMALRDQKFRREEALGWIWRSGVSWRDPEGRSARAEPWPRPLRWAVYRAGGPEMLQCQVVDPLERRRASIQPPEMDTRSDLLMTVVRRRGLMLLVALLWVLITPQVLAQGPRGQLSTNPTPPFDLKDPTAIAEGRRLFHSTCTFYCHGREGRVGKGPKLRGRQLEAGYVYLRIANGFPPMPAYQRSLSEEQLWDLVAYVQSLADATDE